MSYGGEDGIKINLHQLLRAMIEKGASDMHVTTGSPPQSPRSALSPRNS